VPFFRKGNWKKAVSNSWRRPPYRKRLKTQSRKAQQRFVAVTSSYAQPTVGAAEISISSDVDPTIVKHAISRRFDTTTPLLVMNLSEYPLHQGSLGVVRSLGRLGVPAYIVQRRRFMAAGSSRYLAGRFLWDTPGDDVDTLRDGLAAIAKTIGRPTVLIP